MNKDQARKLIQDTFQGEFNKDQLIIFLKNSFHTTDFSKTFSYHGQYIKDSFKEFIKSYERVGQYTDGDGKVLDMLVVYLQKETSLVRARTAQRNFVARYLKDRGEKDAALVAFISPDPADWRFSFVKMEYTFEQTDKGTFKAKEDFTPAKRYSFLVGEHENSHTAQRQLVALLSQDVNQPSFKDIEEVFNIEKVSQEFFERYRDLFNEIKDSLDKNVENDSRIKKDFERCGVDTVDFAKKLLGQIVFLYFLQKKGWFGADKGEPWGTGHKDFLRRLFNKEIVDYKNFFNDVLEPLFYEALATDRGQDAYWDKFQCRIPFLNGGLFEPINGYSWQTTDILLDNELFSNTKPTKQGDKGTGVLDVFDRFNFTVKEDEPLEKEVAVDPEMLGKVFENLLGIKDRKSKGAFYTPRQIVHYMCQESLINYLATECGAKVDREELEEFIRHGEMNIEHEARIIKEGKETRDYRHAIGGTIRANVVEIDQKLAEVRVCDPAVGSGAFLVGMMSEIFRARNILTNYLSTKCERTLYDFKRQSIGHSLYGVDIDPGAVEIAKLRLWLSLVVDEEDTDDIKPLPNLDYKIMQGNSLLEEFEGIKLFDESLIEDALDNHKHIERLKNERDALQQELLKSHNQNKLTKDKRSQLEAQIKNLTRKINKLSKVETVDDEEGDLFKAKGEAKEKRAELQGLYDQFPSAVSKTRKEQLKKRIEELEWDLIETTLKEQNKEDALTRIRQHKQANIKPFFLWKLHFGEVFKEKGGFDVVIGNPPYGADIEKNQLEEIFKHIRNTHNSNSAALFIDFGKNKFIHEKGNLTFIVPKSLLYSEKWFSLVEALLPNTSALVDVEKAFEKVKLEQVVFVYGSTRGSSEYEAKKFLNDVFIRTIFIPKDIVAKTKSWICDVSENELKILNRLGLCVFMKEISETRRGVGLQKSLKNKGVYKVIGGKNIFSYGIDGIKGFLSKTEMEQKKKKLSFMSQPKIVSQDIIAHIQNPFPHIKIMSCLDYVGDVFSVDTVQNTVVKDASFELEYILALLNSVFVSWYTYKFIYCSAIRTMHFDNSYIGKIPVPLENNALRKDIVAKAKQLTALCTEKDISINLAKQRQIEKLRQKIDDLVFDLYGLTEKEKKIVRNQA